MLENQTQTSWKTVFAYFWKDIKTFQTGFWLTIILFALGKIVQGVIIPIYYKDIVDVISSTGERGLVATQLIDLFVILSILIAGSNIIYRFGEYVVTSFQANALKQLADKAFDRLMKHSYSFFTDNFAGSLVAKVKRYVRSFEDIHDQISFSFTMTGVQLVGTFIVLFSVNSILGWLFFLWSLFYIVLSIFFAYKRKRYDIELSKSDSKVTAELSDVISNILNVKIFAAHRREKDIFEATTDEQLARRIDSWNFQNSVDSVQAILLTLLEIVGMYISIRLWLSGTISTGTVVLVQVYISVIGGTIWGLGRSIARFATALSEATEMVELFEKPYEISDHERPLENPLEKGAIQFDSVSFAYSNKGNNVFENFSLAIPDGQRVGLVGTSGGGKSTIVKLLLRFFDVTEGTILIDGKNIREYSQDILRSSIAYVPQEPILFHRSLRENICYGNPSATEAEMIEASKNAHAHEFIMNFPEGYDTLVGERGVKLSGGERQRVAIARAMLTNSPILILDEATSSLDSESEHYIQEAFGKLMEGRTTIVIAHRLSTIRQMDRILVLDDGKILEDGSHDDLLAKKGKYFALWSHQHQGFID